MQPVATRNNTRADRFLKAVYFAYFLGHSGVVAFMSLHLAGLGLTGREIGLLLAVGPVVGIIVQPAWSFLADAKGGVRGALLGALTGAALLSLLIPLGKSYGALLLLLMGWAFFFNGIDPLLNSLALESLGREADGFGRLRLFGSFGNAGSQLLIGVLTQIVHSAAMFLWQALFLLVALANVLAITQGGSGRERALGRRGLVVMLLGSRALLLFLPAALLLQTSQVMGWSYFALYMRAQGAGAVEAGVGLWIAVLSAFPFFHFAQPLLSRFGPHRLLLVSASAYALRWGLLSATGSVGAIYVIQTLNGCCYALYYVAAVALVHKESPAPLKATGQGLLSAVHISLATICGGLLGGLLLDWSDVFWLYRGAAGLALASIPLLIALALAESRKAASGAEGDAGGTKVLE